MTLHGTGIYAYMTPPTTPMQTYIAHIESVDCVVLWTAHTQTQHICRCVPTSVPTILLKTNQSHNYSALLMDVFSFDSAWQRCTTPDVVFPLILNTSSTL